MEYAIKLDLFCGPPPANVNQDLTWLAAHGMGSARMTDADLKIGQELELTIDGMAVGGFGVGRAGGRAVFVPRSIPGERLRVQLVHLGSRKHVAEPLEVLQASPDRIEPPCPVYDQCGGCQLMHLNASAQLGWKHDVLVDTFRSIAGLTADIGSVSASPLNQGYRNRGQYPVAFQQGRVVTGFFAARSHQVVPVEQCLLHDPRVDRMVAVVRAWAGRKRVSIYNEKRHRGWLRHVVVRVAGTSGQLLVALVGRDERGGKLPDLLRRLRRAEPGVAGLVLNVNRDRTNVIMGPEERLLWGRAQIEEELLGLRFRLSAGSFFQINPQVAEQLFSRVLAFLAPVDGTVLDAYCGVGVLALALARQGREAIGIEVAAGTVADARRAAKNNHIDGAIFHQGRVEQVLPRLVTDGLRPAAVILDPPRKGCAPEVLTAVAESQAARIAYVSCHPGTLARDLARLFELGYELEELAAFDMFPHTAHLEVFAGLKRRVT